MRVLMLGWEFPPFITGGLGTACYGLTRALAARGVNVTFVLPTAVDAEHAAHVDLLSPATHPGSPEAPNFAVRTIDAAPTAADDAAPAAQLGAPPRRSDATTPGAPPPGAPPPGGPVRPAAPTFEILEVPSAIRHPYPSGTIPVGAIDREGLESGGPDADGRPAGPFPAGSPSAGTPRGGSAAADVPGAAEDPITGNAVGAGGLDYGDDLVGQVERYARFCLAAVPGRTFDVIHAHDWMTYPAGLWIARATGKPLVVHVHSTEFDRSGENVNQLVYDIERRGMHGAIRVITVSQLTKNMVVARYGVPAAHVEVVYNGVEQEAPAPIPAIRSRDKIVLYFGRITYQKGPEYFVRAAKRVLEHMDDVKFVVAGSGDMARHMIEMAAALGIGHKVLFTGFLRGKDIQRVFSLADLYVMPSVSEPFGIAPLEAMGHDVPVLISKSSGVSEVLTHALKVDFWDVDDMANKIIAVLKYPPLSQTLREHGRMEVRQLTWDGAAERCEQVYRAAIADLAPIAARGV